MKSKPSVFSLVLLLAAITATASPAAHDVTAAAKPEHISATEPSCPAAGHERPTRDTRRDESYVGWRRLIPTRLTVQFAGGPHYTSSNAASSSSRPKAGPAKVTAISKGAKHPYHVVHTNRQSSVYGWVDADKVSK